ncbi:LamG domain-containing protein [Archaeoglobus profundus]|uniref:LamG domain-containing protein n=1 Tax=Archaeoglobus profundus TaxID=84156 RepID=UPI001FE1FE2B|nr:LamG domain-containing protein [Archaeoglobus profundus]
MVGVASAGVITPPLADDPSLVLRLSFDDYKFYHFGFEQTLYDDNNSEDFNSYGSLSYSTNWKTDGEYSLYGDISGDEAAIYEAFGYRIVVTYDVFVSGKVNNGELRVLVGGSVVKSYTGGKYLNESVTVPAGEDIKFQWYAPTSNDRIQAYIDNIRILKVQADDQSGNGNNGNIYGANWTVGRYGYALSFDDGEYVEVPNSSIWWDWNEITVCAWVKFLEPRKESWDRLVDSNRWTGKGAWLLFADKYSSNTLLWGVTDKDDAGNVYFYQVAYKNIQPNEWYFVVGTYNGSYVKLYVNGKLVSQRDAPTMNISANGVIIGFKNSPTDDTLRIIDEVRIYNRALSDEEIKAMYEALRVKFYDESTGQKIKANATIFNANHSINLQVDSITKEAVLFHADVPEYGKYQVKVEAGGYSPRYYGVNLTDDKRIELDTYLPPSDKSVLIIFQLEDNANFYNNNTMLILKKAFTDGSKTVYQNYFDIEKKCSVYLIADDIYHVYVDNGIETKYLGIYSSSISTTATLKIGEEISQIIQKGVTLPLHTVTLIVIKALKPYAHVPIAIRDTVHGNSYVVYTDDEGKAVIWVNSTIPYEIDVNNSEKVLTTFLPLKEKYIVVVPYNVTPLNQTYNVLYNVTNGSVLQIGKNISSQLSPSARGILTAIILWAVMQSTVRVVGNVSVVGLAVLVILTIIGLADPMSCVFAGTFVVGMYVLKRWL